LKSTKSTKIYEIQCLLTGLLQLAIKLMTSAADIIRPPV